MPLNPTPSTPTLGSPGYRHPARDSAERAGARSRDVSPLGVARTAFELLTTGPSPLALDTRGCPGLPDRPVPLDELRSRLLAASCPAETPSRSPCAPGLFGPVPPTVLGSRQPKAGALDGRNSRDWSITFRTQLGRTARDEPV